MGRKRPPSSSDVLPAAPVGGGSIAPGWMHEADRLASGLADHPHSGCPLPTLGPASTLAGYLIGIAGAPRFAARLCEIDRLTESHRLRLQRLAAELAERNGAGSELLAARWRRVAREWDFSDVNALIDQHNCYYPIERGLGIDPATGEYLPELGRCYRREPLAEAWVLEQLSAADDGPVARASYARATE